MKEQQRCPRSNQKRKFSEDDVPESMSLFSTDFLKNIDGKKKLLEICKFVRHQPLQYHTNIEKILNSILNNKYQYSTNDKTLPKFIQDLQEFFLKKDRSLYERFQIQISPLCCSTRPTEPGTSAQQVLQKKQKTQTRKSQLDDNWLCLPAKSIEFVPTKNTFPRICSIIMKEFNAAQRYSLFQLNNSYFNCSKTSDDDKSYYSELADLYNDPTYYAGNYFHLDNALVFLKHGIRLHYQEPDHSRITGYFFFQILQETIRSYLAQLKRYHEAQREYEAANDPSDRELLDLMLERKKSPVKKACEPFPSFSEFLGEGQLDVLFLHSSLASLEEVPLLQFVKRPRPSSPSLASRRNKMLLEMERDRDDDHEEDHEDDDDEEECDDQDEDEDDEDDDLDDWLIDDDDEDDEDEEEEDDSDESPWDS